MRKFILVTSILSLFFVYAFFKPSTSLAAPSSIEAAQSKAPMNLLLYSIGRVKDDDGSGEETDGAFTISTIAPLNIALTGYVKDGVVLKAGLLPQQGRFLAMVYNNQISSQEYVADILNNIGVPTVPRAYAQGTGYEAMKPFLSFWKVFRNLAYSLYIVMFVVVGIMIMLRTKVNAQTIITIQAALPNLLITLLLITFSYAIVGLMIDIMYFLIYFVVYLLSSPGINIISTPTKAITRLLSQSAYSVVFAGRNSIVSAVSIAITDVLDGIGTGMLDAAGSALGFISWTGLGYLIVAVWLGLSMLKLMWELVKCYVMLIVQTVTAPLQILMNAMPGSKAFSNWLKKTASYMIPFPVVASMFILAAVLIGNPADKTIFGSNGGPDSEIDGNPFGINGSNPLYDSYGSGRTVSTSGATGNIWMPPFTLTDYEQSPANLMIIIGFFIVTMTPFAAKMAQEWLQVKESPYASEAISNFGGFAAFPVKGAYGAYQRKHQENLQRSMYSSIGEAMGDKISGDKKNG